MLSTNDLRSGLTVNFEGSVYLILEAEHVKQGRGSAFVRVRMKNVETGAIINRTLRAGDKIEQAVIQKREMQYLYASGDEHHFMDTESYDQIPVRAEVLGDGLKFLKENMVVHILEHDGRVIGVELPNSVELTVTETEPGVKGDTVSGATKPAKLETGAVVQVPLFVGTGDVIRVDTRSGHYLGRV
ncbi:MAG TPA: elongation factor P [Bacillota bacterium]